MRGGAHGGGVAPTGMVHHCTSGRGVLPGSAQVPCTYTAGRVPSAWMQEGAAAGAVVVAAAGPPAARAAAARIARRPTVRT